MAEGLKNIPIGEIEKTQQVITNKRQVRLKERLGKLNSMRKIAEATAKSNKKIPPAKSKSTKITTHVKKKVA